ncbi:MAG TPA: molybdopterin-dependent oxidoreductase [Desulfosporosinus sp.]|nr:molybdopterin-dependent oxidoreductase [Desulfosporosinus sp.]
MSNIRGDGGRRLGKRLVSIHAWNAMFVLLLALSGLVLSSTFWREALGGTLAWIKWFHIIMGLASIVPVPAYLQQVSKHWKQLHGKFPQQLNIILTLLLLVSWFISGVLLWRFNAVGPAVTNAALLVHDVLTWIGLPYILYHSLTRVGRRKEDGRISVINTKAIYTRKAFIRTIIGASLTISLGPTLIKWLAKNGTGKDLSSINKPVNNLLPAPQPLVDSNPPIGGGADGSFRSYTVAKIPSFTNANWSFKIDGLVDHPVTWNWEQFVALKRSVQVSDFHCVTGWSVYGNTWEGIPLKTLLEESGVQPPAKVVKLYSGDGVYTDSLTLEQVKLDEVMVAVMHDGKPIPDELGGPVRLIIPKMYAYKSVKWLNRIELIEENHIGYWGQRGYENDAWVK